MAVGEARDTRTTTAAAAAPLPPRLILYDNVCGFCDNAVQSLLERDTAERFHYAALQGETAAALRATHPNRIPDDIDTLVYVDSTGPEPVILLRSRAVLAILAELPGPVRALRWLRIVPQPLTDLAYRAFAALRYRLFGKLDSCRLPTPAERARFLD